MRYHCMAFVACAVHCMCTAASGELFQSVSYEDSFENSNLDGFDVYAERVVIGDSTYMKTDGVWASESEDLVGAANTTQVVSVYKNTVVIGRRQNGIGKVYIYQKSGDSFQRKSVLKNSKDSDFAKSVSVYGRYVAVGSTTKVYVYSFSNRKGWYLQKTLFPKKYISGVPAEYVFQVSVWGSTVAISGPGKCLVFIRRMMMWKFQAAIKGEDKPTYSDGYGFGSAISLSEDTLAVGYTESPLERELRTPCSTCGRVYIFIRVDKVWEQQSVLTNEDVPNSIFGDSLSLSGDSLVVGDSTSRKIHVFIRMGTTWSALDSIESPGESDFFGNRVQVNGDHILGSRLDSEDSSTTRVYKKSCKMRLLICVEHKFSRSNSKLSKQVAVMKKFLSNADIGEDGTRVGLLRFGNKNVFEEIIPANLSVAENYDKDLIVSETMNLMKNSKAKKSPGSGAYNEIFKTSALPMAAEGNPTIVLLGRNFPRSRSKATEACQVVKAMKKTYKATVLCLQTSSRDSISRFFECACDAVWVASSKSSMMMQPTNRLISQQMKRLACQMKQETYDDPCAVVQARSYSSWRKKRSACNRVSRDLLGRPNSAACSWESNYKRICSYSAGKCTVKASQSS
eukprot:CAMPEP_0203790654 /NCGR_PEP_ID=MMETSP0100_2-20121128/4170_1 /ASSEMBLY_ACC=CAM_ASM_000210 /TAXON_ID=96639 /ORGANISM=" , Strain NY0313808BC1" /LENGTH=622 /DNA_ID=CAMNT_0050693827 /DNA_START=137 /DNA_END=2001 /DNA_ORIENTATION=+